MNTKNIFIISGPSGAGEDSIISGLKEKVALEAIVTTVTRTMREGESNGRPYYFISEEEFKDKIQSDEMAEWAQHYNGNYYGVTKRELDRVSNSGKIGIWKIDYKGVSTAKSLFPDIIAIFIMADSLEILEQRIRSRNDVTEEYVTERMDYTREWLKHTDLYDYSVINKQGALDKAIEEIVTIIERHSI